MGDRDVDWLDQLCEADEKIVELESENAKLRDQLRWRKWPEDDPAETERQYLVVDKHGRFSTNYWGQDGDGSGCWNEYVEYGSYWRPIAPLPGGE
jgi:hypothetical protein